MTNTLTNPQGFYFSFTDPERPKGTQFLGGAYVPATTLEMALTRSHLRGYNPGGQVMTIELASMPPEVYWDRLLAREELTEVDDLMSQQLEES